MPLFSESDAVRFIAQHLTHARRATANDSSDLADYVHRRACTARVPIDLVLDWVYSNCTTVTVFDFSDWLKSGEVPL
jgi:hypothetical protein